MSKTAISQNAGSQNAGTSGDVIGLKGIGGHGNVLTGNDKGALASRQRRNAPVSAAHELSGSCSTRYVR